MEHLRTLGFEPAQDFFALRSLDLLPCIQPLPAAPDYEDIGSWLPPASMSPFSIQPARGISCAAATAAIATNRQSKRIGKPGFPF